MKIGIVCPYDLTRGGGVQEHVLAQATELKKRGHEVRILTPKPRQLNGQTLEDVIFIGNSRVVKAAKTMPTFSISTARDEIDEVLARENFDVLHVHEPELPMLAAQIIGKAQCPIVATFHAMMPENAMGRTIEAFRNTYARSLFSKLDALTAVSEAAAQSVRERTGKPVMIVPNGIDLTKYQPYLSSSRRITPTIVYVGRLEKRKGVRFLLKAFKQLQLTQPDAQLIIAGDGDSRNSLEMYVADNDIQNVDFLGFISEQQKLELLSTATVFCSPAVYGESFGIVLLEAMAAQTPIVAGDNPGYSTVLTEHGKLSLVNPRDTQDFARRLDIFLHDEALRKLWITWSKTYVQGFTYDKIVNKYELLYKQAVKK